MDRSISRRRLLSTSALGGAGTLAALLLGASRARAFKAQPMDARTHELYMQRCSQGNSAYHDELLAEAKAQLAGKASDAEIEAALAQLTCPICGCPLIASR